MDVVAGVEMLYHPSVFSKSAGQAYLLEATLAPSFHHKAAFVPETVHRPRGVQTLSEGQ